MKNSIKREQSQACLNFAERKNFRLQAKNKILSLLVLLLTAASGAWAQGYNVTFSGFAESEMNTTVNVTSLPETFTQIGNAAFYPWTVISTSGNIFINASVTSGGEGKVSVSVVKSINDMLSITITGPFEGTATIHVEGEDDENRHISTDITVSCEAVGGAASDVTVDWNASTKTGTFSMPGSDVVLTPQYAPTAKWATEGDKVLAPTPVEGVIAGTDAPIVVEGTVANAGETENLQGTAKYFATTDATMTAEKAAKADGWLSTPPSAQGYDDATTVYVWYFIQGADTPQGETATAENTFNDLEICSTPLQVSVLSNKFDLTLKPTRLDKISVEVNGTAANVTSDGKVAGVKMGSDVKLKAQEGYKFRKVEVKKAEEAVPDVKIESFNIQSSKNTVFSDGTFTCSIIDILPANATNQTFEWKIKTDAPAGTTIQSVSDDTKSVTIKAGTVSSPASFTIEVTAKDGGGATKLKSIMVAPGLQ